MRRTRTRANGRYAAVALATVAAATAASCGGNDAQGGGRGKTIALLLPESTALESSVKFIVTGGVLLVAVTLDALSRRRRRARGRL